MGVVVVAFCSATIPAKAVPISIDFEFSPITVAFNGVTQSTGNISMSIVTDTTTTNSGTGFSAFQNFYSADVYFTAAALGLNHTRVNMATDLYFGSSVVGFRVSNFSTIFTAYNGSALSFGSPFNLSTLVVPQGPISLSGTEFRTAQAIQFENGDYFDAGNFTSFQQRQNSVSVSNANVSNVPEPESVTLVGLALVGLAAIRRRRQV